MSWSCFLCPQSENAPCRCDTDTIIVCASQLTKLPASIFLLVTLETISNSTKPCLACQETMRFGYSGPDSLHRSICDLTMCSPLFRCRVQSTSVSASTAGCWLPVAMTTTCRQRSLCPLPRASLSRKYSKKLSNFFHQQYSMRSACGQTNWHIDKSPSELESEGCHFESR
jgi:hypothetical protein